VEHYVTLERAISCPRASAAVAADTAAQLLTSAGYRRGLGFGPTQSYVRAYRPAWALFLVRVKDHCNVVIEDGPYGVVALVSGRVPATFPAQLEAASGTYPEQSAQGAGGQFQQPPPMLLAPSNGRYEGSQPQQQPAILRPATPVPGLFPQPPPDPGYQPAPGQLPGYAIPAAPPPPAAQPGQPQPAPVAFRPPSRLAPPMPPDAADVPGSAANRSGANAAAPAAPNAAPGAAARASDDDPFSSTSGRVPWPVAGSSGRAPGMPAPAGAPPVSPGAWSPNGSGASAAHPASQGAPQHAGASGAAGPSRPAGGAVRQPQPGGVVTAVSGATRYVLRVDSGEVLDLGPFCLLGREPVPRDGDPPATVVRFDDAKLSVSKTHIAYGVDDTGLWVMDRNSTNGTTIIDPSGRRIPCAPGAREYLQAGAQVQIGQRRFTVEVPDGAAG
jgi:hypothetical protein